MSQFLCTVLHSTCALLLYLVARRRDQIRQCNTFKTIQNLISCWMSNNKISFWGRLVQYNSSTFYIKLKSNYYIAHKEKSTSQRRKIINSFLQCIIRFKRHISISSQCICTPQNTFPQWSTKTASSHLFTHTTWVFNFINIEVSDTVGTTDIHVGFNHFGVDLVPRSHCDTNASNVDFYIFITCWSFKWRYSRLWHRVVWW
jgi:hypothetical protein